MDFRCSTIISFFVWFANTYPGIYLRRIYFNSTSNFKIFYFKKLIKLSNLTVIWIKFKANLIRTWFIYVKLENFLKIEKRSIQVNPLAGDDYKKALKHLVKLYVIKVTPFMNEYFSCGLTLWWTFWAHLLIDWKTHFHFTTFTFCNIILKLTYYKIKEIHRSLTKIQKNQSICRSEQRVYFWWTWFE